MKYHSILLSIMLLAWMREVVSASIKGVLREWARY